MTPLDFPLRMPPISVYLRAGSVPEGKKRGHLGLEMGDFPPQL